MKRKNNNIVAFLSLLVLSCSNDPVEVDFKTATNIPSSSFEQALINIGIDADGVLNGEVLTDDITKIIYLPLTDQSITDLSGIEKFTGLKKLECNDNQLTSINVSQNKDLKEFNCRDNQLTNLDVSQNTALTSLLCSRNQLSSLNVSQNTLLSTLGCSGNDITSLDVRQNIALTQLYCSENQLTSLDVGQNINLMELFCFENQLTSLDTSLNIALMELYCNDNLLTSLNVKNGNNAILTEFDALNNDGFLCVQVDQETAANAGQAPYNIWIKDATATYSEDCDSN